MSMTDVMRCFGSGDELYERYHDEEWGKPVGDSADERELFEVLALEGFQAGLSWRTVLRKREAFRELFAGFVPAEVAEFDDADVVRLMRDERIIRNFTKIDAAITNARALLTLHDEGLRLLDVFEEFAPPQQRPRAIWPSQVRSHTDETVALSKVLKNKGFRFVGPVTLYATMQAIGMVDDHLANCHLVDSDLSNAA